MCGEEPRLHAFLNSALAKSKLACLDRYTSKKTAPPPRISLQRVGGLQSFSGNVH